MPVYCGQAWLIPKWSQWDRLLNHGKKVMEKHKPSAEVQTTLSREMNLLQITAIGIGAMIGAGIFILTGIAAGQAGPALILVFVLNGIIALIVGACYAELASAMPRAGGPYYWLKVAIGPRWGFFAGWMSWFASILACSLYALGFGAFAAKLLEGCCGPFILASQQLSLGIAIIIMLVFLFVNYRGAEEAGWTEVVITGTKLAILFAFGLFGLALVIGENNVSQAFIPFFPEGTMGVLSAMGLTFIAFEGYEIITRSAEEVKEPEKNIPRAIFLSIGTAVILYLMIAVVMLGTTHTPQGEPVYLYLGRLGELGMVESAGQLLPYGTLVMLVAGLASTGSALNATLYSASRVSFAMGRGRDLPTFLARIAPVRRTPHLAIAVTGVLSMAMLLLLPIREVAASTSLMFMLLFALVCYSLIRLRHKLPDIKRSFRLPLVPLLPWVGVVSCVVLSFALIDLSLSAWITVSIWIVIGVVVNYRMPGKQ